MLPDDYDLPDYDGPTVTFVIRYWQEQSEEKALLLARRLYNELDFRIESLTLVPVDDDEFAVWLDGELVHSLVESGRDPSVGAIVKLAWERLDGRGSVE
jgi:hypothetical protein